jgi:[acyl-carrier-protein] S-malonyltransferase
MTVVFLFPGQNSRYPAMIDKLVESDPCAEATMARASEILGRDLREHYRADNPAIFARNRDVQIGVFLANLLCAEKLSQRGVSPDFSLGLSLGEYNHLVDIGALDLEQALPLLEARGKAYEKSPAGAMAAMQPLSEDAALEILAAVNAGPNLAVGMRNAPTQQVFSGERAAVESACIIAEEQHGAKAVLIEDRLPMHSPLFRGVANEFRAALNAVEWAAHCEPYLPNATAEIVENPTPADFSRLLSAHLYSPVLWKQSIDWLRATFSDIVFIEVGPKSVLSSLLGTGWDGRPPVAVDSPEGLAARIARIGEICLGTAQPA